MEKLSPAVMLFIYERHTENVRHKEWKKGQWKAVTVTMSSKHFKAKIITRDKRDH